MCACVYLIVIVCDCVSLRLCVFVRVFVCVFARVCVCGCVCFRVSVLGVRVIVCC